MEAIEDQLANLEVKWAAEELVQRAYDRAKPVPDQRLAAARARHDGSRMGSAAPADAALMGRGHRRRGASSSSGSGWDQGGPHRPGARRCDRRGSHHPLTGGAQAQQRRTRGCPGSGSRGPPGVPPRIASYSLGT